MATVGVAVGNIILDKIQSFLNDPLYSDLTQNTAKFNAAIRKDRVYRQPYIDGQTGVAQRHCNLFVSDKQRMPGILQGQVYTYPARRWRCTNRSYLASFTQQVVPRIEPEEHTITTVENPAVLIANPVVVPEEMVVIPVEKPIKEPWTYFEENTYDEEMEVDFESDEDFEDETYNRKGTKRRKIPGRKPKVPGTVKKKKVVLKAPARLIRAIKKDENDTENKPYVCELCGMRYKTRPGLTYHYAHSHKDEGEEEKPKPATTPTKPIHHIVAVDQVKPCMQVPFNISAPSTPPSSWPESNGMQGRTNRRAVGLSVPPLQESVNDLPIIPSTVPETLAIKNDMDQQMVVKHEPILNPDKIDFGRKRVPPSPYCDFCLGDSSENKKTGQSEQLVSCADCGRSGHPSCLQFTDNMMKSVLRYRWQCIECKTCTLCGTSENDDQLLFCDDCDRGYHLYCLNPPLSEPPEGEWSCSLCIKEFHN